MSSHPFAQSPDALEAVNQAVESVEKSVAQARESVEKTVAQARDSVHHAKERVEETFAHTCERVGQAKDQLGASVGSAYEHSRQSLSNTVDRTRSVWQRAGLAVNNWFDTSVAVAPVSIAEDKIDWLRTLPFIGLHVMCLGVFIVGFSWTAFAVAVAMYVLRMFAITGFYHRYFSHKTFKTSRAMQFIMGLWGASSVQRGPMWWASHHRHHHKHSDQPTDFHSPMQHGFWWSHMGWIMGKSAFRTDEAQIPDLAKFPELKWLDRFDIAVPVLLAVALLFLGMALEKWAPGLGTNGAQMLVWGFFVSTVVLFHGTVTINSLSHVWGNRRYKTKDDSRNNWFLAIVTLGEGWHNNHHHYPGSARQGFFWWEYDVTYYGLKMLNWCGLIWDLKPVPPQFKNAHLKYAKD